MTVNGRIVIQGKVKKSDQGGIEMYHQSESSCLPLKKKSDQGGIEITDLHMPYSTC